MFGRVYPYGLVNKWNLEMETRSHGGIVPAETQDHGLLVRRYGCRSQATVCTTGATEESRWEGPAKLGHCLAVPKLVLVVSLM